MEGIVVTDLVPAVEEPEITSDATTGPEPAEPLASDGSGGGDGSEVSCLWSLTHEQQVNNLKENWARVFFRLWRDEDYEVGPWFARVVAKTQVDPSFARVVAKLRVDPCLDSCELEIDQRCAGGGIAEVMMTSLDAAILMGDLKMVQKILESSSIPNELTPETTFSRPETDSIFTPLHLAVVGGDSHIVAALLEKGADVNAQDRWHESPLDLACKTGNVTMLLQLLEKDREEGRDPLHVAVRHGDIDFMKKLPSLNVNAVDRYHMTPLHCLATDISPGFDVTNVVRYLAKHKVLDMKALDGYGRSAFYLAVLHCNTPVVIALLDSFKDQIRLNEACDDDLGPPIQIAFEGGFIFRDIERALMECDPVKSYMEILYRDRQVYVDAANAILVGAALIASVTFASWLQPPLNYTSYSGEGYSSSVPAPSTSDFNYVDVEHNIALRAFWVFNALSFYFAIGTVVCGARSVLPRSHLFIKRTVEKLRLNLLVTSVLLACAVLFVIIAFAIAGTIVLTPQIKYQWYMIVPTIVGGLVCIISLVFLVKSMAENIINRSERSKQKARRDYFRKLGWRESTQRFDKVMQSAVDVLISSCQKDNLS